MIMNIIYTMIGIGILLTILLLIKKSRKNYTNRSINKTTGSVSLAAIILAKEFGDTLESVIAELVASGHSRDDIAKIATDLAAVKVMAKHGVTKEIMVQAIEEYAKEQSLKNANY